MKPHKEEPSLSLIPQGALESDLHQSESHGREGLPLEGAEPRWCVS